MKFRIIWILSLWMFSCSHQTGNTGKLEPENRIEPDGFPIVGKSVVQDEIAGSAYIDRAIRYFLVTNSDTSGFQPILAKWKETGKISIDLNLPYTNTAESWSQQLSELKLILPVAAKDFAMDSLQHLSVGRLVLTGDLAVEITKNYIILFGEPGEITTSDYHKISEFLLASKLGEDLNQLFNPYGILVEEISIEKAFFTTREELCKISRVTGDTAHVPNEILDCITWVKFKAN